MLKFDKEQVHWQVLDSGAPKPVSTSSWATQENLRGDEPELETFEHEGALSLLWVQLYRGVCTGRTPVNQIQWLVVMTGVITVRNTKWPGANHYTKLSNNRWESSI